MSLRINLEPSDKYRRPQMDEPEPQVRKEDVEPLPIPLDVTTAPQQHTVADPKSILGQPQYAESTKLEKQIDGGGSPKRRNNTDKKSRIKEPEIQDGVKIYPFPRSLYNVIDNMVPVSNASYAEKTAAIIYSLVGDESMKDVSPFIRYLAEEYGYNTANELRSLRNSIDKVSQQSDLMIKMSKDIKMMNDKELYAISFMIFHRLGFSMQPPVAPSEVNFNVDGVDDLRHKLSKDYKKHRDEISRKNFGR